MKKILHLTLLFWLSFQMNAQNVTITQATGWLESAYVTWSPVEGADSYKVYYTGGGLIDQLIDTQLIRNYGTYFRADVLGLSAGNYTLKVVPVTANIEGEATISETVTVLPHDRNGFAHSNGKIPGGYNLDGTVKNNAVILYISQETKNTVSLVVVGANSNPCVGLQTILDGFKKGNDNRPLIVRLIGNITDLNYMLSGDIVIENNNNVNGSITFEGVGSDALVNGWGLRIKKGSNIEVRNLGFMLTNANEGDNVSLQQDNNYVWVHHCDMFYGAPGGDADQAKGDGSLDCKRSTYVTFSYNHFWDTGKSCLLGLSENTNSGLYITYHHNWFDHSDSRHPRVRYYSAHVYNNYFDGISKYGVGSTLGSSVFVEGNFFRTCKYPMMISKQGTDILGGSNGTFSGENGGIIKAFNNEMSGQTSFLPYNATTNPAQFDAYVATTRNENVSNTITSFQGNSSYNNFDTDPTLYVNALVIDSPTVAKDNVMAYSGRVSGGDISWTFNNAIDDTHSAVNTGLMALLNGYTSSLVAIQGITPIESSQTLIIPENNEQTVAEGNAISNMVFTWGGTATDVTVTGLPAFGIDFVKNMTEKTVTISGTPTDEVSFTIATIGTTGASVSGSGSITIGVPSSGDEIHNFTTSGLTSSFYSFTSANMNSNPGLTTYDDLTLTARLKIETPTVITYTTFNPSTLTLVFDPTFNGIIKLNGVNHTASSGVAIIPNVPAGTNLITKGGTTNLYYIKTQYSSLGTNEFTKNEIGLYPNPVTNELNISLSNNQIIQNVSVYSIVGQLVKRINGSSTKVDTSELSSGVYLINIQTNKGVFDKKIIKK
ncbi:pectate lyase [Flavobacterium arsenatis]|uniref:Pectate lyase n=1 Tax=Flavobacterium arsenatis TaxID=1484332 RepID=A0ABU1TUT3_9FLAO|nr:T9SS type A sorting domain-containing protein [Flavobacterium arsenatis]MDR6969635.1 pectate lyase [Flavobacterium arsenatis]